MASLHIFVAGFVIVTIGAGAIVITILSESVKAQSTSLVAVNVSVTSPLSLSACEKV